MFDIIILNVLYTLHRLHFIFPGLKYNPLQDTFIICTVKKIPKLTQDSESKQTNNDKNGYSVNAEKLILGAISVDTNKT